MEYLCYDLDTQREMIRNLLYKLYWRLTINEWQIGFPQTTRENIAMGGRYKIALLKGVPNGRWFADPFILDVTPTHIILLVEEFVNATAKGRIARLTISRNDYTLQRNDTLLDLDTHLSFPTIVRQGGAVYVIPENSAGGKLNAYIYDEAAAKLVPYTTLCPKPLIDALHHDIDGNEYIFATQGPDANGTKLDDKGMFTFTETARLKSPRKHLDHGMHTLNEYKGVTVVDVSSYRRPTISSIVDAVWKHFNLPTSLE